MEISTLSEGCIKIKSKNASVIVDPETLRTKNSSDAVILLRNDKYDNTKVEGVRLVIKGSGEYEFSGVKVSAFGSGDGLIFELHVDGLNLLLGKTDDVEKAKEKIKEYDIVVLYPGSKVDQTLLAPLSPKIAVFYGQNAQESLSKDVLKEENKPVSKFVTKVGSLPEEMQVILLA